MHVGKGAFSRTALAFALVGFSTNISAQETREYILSVDFGPQYNQADFWFNWAVDQSRSQVAMEFANVFNPTGFQLTAKSQCDADSPRSGTDCKLETLFRATVDEDQADEIDPVVEDALFAAGRRLTLTLTDLASGTYDFKGYFHDALTSHDNRITVRITDSRSPEGFTLSRSVRISTGQDNPTVSTFTFPIEVNGTDTVQIDFDSNLDGIWLNGFELTSYRYRDRLATGVELIPDYRHDEGLITAYLDNNDRLYACLGLDAEGQWQLGAWSSDDTRCLSLGSAPPTVLSDHRLVKFDPYFEWFKTSGTPPPRAVDFAGDNVTGAQYACIATAPSGEYYPGVIKGPDGCRIRYQGEVLTYGSYWIFTHKPG
jgi:hypothetical protein